MEVELGRRITAGDSRQQARVKLIAPAACCLVALSLAPVAMVLFHYLPRQEGWFLVVGWLMFLGGRVLVMPLFVVLPVAVGSWALIRGIDAVGAAEQVAGTSGPFTGRAWATVILGALTIVSAVISSVVITDMLLPGH